MKRATKIRLVVVTLTIATIGGWIARGQIEKYVANRRLHDLVLIDDAGGVT